MADVFVAIDQQERDDKLLALKVLRDYLADDPQWVASFLEEARVSLLLDHPNVVETREVGDLGGAHAIVLEYLEGASLGELRRTHVHHQTQMPLAIGLHVLAEALAGLHYAHELQSAEGKPLQLVHRDFTPNNIFVTLDGRVKVLDFGLAKTTETSAKTSTGVVKGTIRYLAPEAILGIYVDRRVDLYAAGVALWELASGMRAWDGLADVTVLNKVSTGESLKLREACPDADDELVAICDRAVAHARKDRFPSAEALANAIRSYAERSGNVCTPAEFDAYASRMLGPLCLERRESFERARRASRRPPLAPPHAGGDSTETRRLVDETKAAAFTSSVSTRFERAQTPPSAPSPPRRRPLPFVLGGLGAASVAGFLLTRRAEMPPPPPREAHAVVPPRDAPLARETPPEAPPSTEPRPTPAASPSAELPDAGPTRVVARPVSRAAASASARPPEAKPPPADAPRRIDEKNPFE